MRQIRIGKVALTSGGVWNASTGYPILTFVLHNGDGWWSYKANINSEPSPSNANWIQATDTKALTDALKEQIDDAESLNAAMNEAEEIRKENEAARVAAEESRNESEEERKANETERIRKEELREDAEAVREENEQRRLAEDETRGAAFDAHLETLERRFENNQAAMQQTFETEMRELKDGFGEFADEAKEEESKRQQQEEIRKQTFERSMGAVDAAVALANKAASDADVVSERAEKVDANIDGTRLVVTTRNGERQSVELKGDKGDKGDKGSLIYTQSVHPPYGYVGQVGKECYHVYTSNTSIAGSTYMIDDYVLVEGVLYKVTNRINEGVANVRLIFDKIADLNGEDGSNIYAAGAADVSSYIGRKIVKKSVAPDGNLVEDLDYVVANGVLYKVGGDFAYDKAWSYMNEVCKLTPVRGVDYWTDEDQQAVKQEAQTIAEGKMAEMQQTFEDAEAARGSLFEEKENERTTLFADKERNRQATFDGKEAERDAAVAAAMQAEEKIAELGLKVGKLDEQINGGDGKELRYEQSITATTGVGIAASRNKFAVELKNGDDIIVTVKDASGVIYPTMNGCSVQFFDDSNTLLEAKTVETNADIGISLTYDVAYIGLYADASKVVGDGSIVLHVVRPSGLAVAPIAEELESVKRGMSEANGHIESLSESIDAHKGEIDAISELLNGKVAEYKSMVIHTTGNYQRDKLPCTIPAGTLIKKVDGYSTDGSYISNFSGRTELSDSSALSVSKGVVLDRDINYASTSKEVLELTIECDVEDVKGIVDEIEALKSGGGADDSGDAELDTNIRNSASVLTDKAIGEKIEIEASSYFSVWEVSVEGMRGFVRIENVLRWAYVVDGENTILQKYVAKNDANNEASLAGFDVGGNASKIIFVGKKTNSESGSYFPPKVYFTTKKSQLPKATLLFHFDGLDGGGKPSIIGYRKQLCEQYGIVKGSFCINPSCFNADMTDWASEDFKNDYWKAVEEGWDAAFYPASIATDRTEEQWNAWLDDCLRKLANLGIHNITTFACGKLQVTQPLIDAVKAHGFKIIRGGKSSATDNSEEYAYTFDDHYMSQSVKEDNFIVCFSHSGFAESGTKDTSIGRIYNFIDYLCESKTAGALFTHSVLDTTVSTDGINISLARFELVLGYIKQKIDAGLLEPMSWRQWYALVNPADGHDNDYLRTHKSIKNERNVIAESNVKKIVNVGSTRSITSIKDAVDTANVLAIDGYNVDIVIDKGTYDAFEGINLSQQDSTFQGLTLENNVNIVGNGSASEVIINGALPKNMSGFAYQRNSVAVFNSWRNNSYKNITINATNMRYCIHNDKSPNSMHVDDAYELYDSIILNSYQDADVDTKAAAWPIGSAACNGRVTEFRFCIFNNAANTDHCVNIHNRKNSTKPCQWIFESCQMIGGKYGAFYIGSEGTHQRDIVSIKGCKIPNEINFYSLSGYTGDNEMNLCGYGNSLNGFNYRTGITDGSGKDMLL